jgi:acyl carrier protein
MQEGEIRERVLRVVGDMAPLREAEVAAGADLRDDLGYDSLSLLELAAALEDEFKLPPAAELDTEEVDTVEQVVGVVARKLEAVA